MEEDDLLSTEENICIKETTTPDLMGTHASIYTCCSPAPAESPKKVLKENNGIPSILINSTANIPI